MGCGNSIATGNTDGALSTLSAPSSVPAAEGDGVKGACVMVLDSVGDGIGVCSRAGKGACRSTHESRDMSAQNPTEVHVHSCLPTIALMSFLLAQLCTSLRVEIGTVVSTIGTVSRSTPAGLHQLQSMRAGLGLVAPRTSIRTPIRPIGASADP